MYNQDQVNKIIDCELKKKGIAREDNRIYVLAIRGNSGTNQIGVFDDRAYLSYDHTIKGEWNMNTDPSVENPGMANLCPGVWRYQAGKHHIDQDPPLGRAAFIQAGVVTVNRENQGEDTGFFGINLHDAMSGTTSSEGCQTFQQYGGVAMFYNSKGTGFRDVAYRILGVTPDQVMANPHGCGDFLYYILVDLTTAEDDLKS